MGSPVLTIRSFTTAVAALCLAGCLTLAAADPSYDAAIEALVKEDPVSLSGLWSLPSFIAMSSKGPDSVNAAILFLNTPGRSMAEQRMAIISMYLLNYKDYARFLQSLIPLYRARLIGPDMIGAAINVPLAFSVELQKNHAQPEVLTALEQLGSLRDLPPPLLKALSGLMSGEAWSRTKAFCRDQLFDRQPDCRNLSWYDLF